MLSGLSNAVLPLRSDRPRRLRVEVTLTRVLITTIVGGFRVYAKIYSQEDAGAAG